MELIMLPFVFVYTIGLYTLALCILYIGIKGILKTLKERRLILQEAIENIYIEDLIIKNKFEEAFHIIEKRLKTNKNDAFAYYYQGKGLFSIGKYHESRRSFERAYELKSDLNESFEIWCQRIENTK